MEILTIVNGHLPNVHKINAGVSQGSALSPALFPIHFNDLLLATSNPIHCLAGESTLRSSISLNQPVSVTELIINRGDGTAPLGKDFDIIKDWGTRFL